MNVHQKQPPHKCGTGLLHCSAWVCAVVICDCFRKVSEVKGGYVLMSSEKDERAILIALYDATDGANWNNNTNWKTDNPLSE